MKHEKEESLRRTMYDFFIAGSLSFPVSAGTLEQKAVSAVETATDGLVVKNSISRNRLKQLKDSAGAYGKSPEEVNRILLDALGYPIFQMVFIIRGHCPPM